MISTMEVPTGYRRRVKAYEATSGVISRGPPREGSVFYESPTAFIRRVNAENGIGAKVTPQPTIITELSDRVAKETLIFERALNVLTSGRPAAERIRELREQEAAYVLLHRAYKGMRKLETATAQLLIHAIQYAPV